MENGQNIFVYWKFLVEHMKRKESCVVWDEIYSILDTCTPDPWSRGGQQAQQTMFNSFHVVMWAYSRLIFRNFFFSKNIISFVHWIEIESYSLRSVSWFTFIPFSWQSEERCERSGRKILHTFTDCLRELGTNIKQRKYLHGTCERRMRGRRGKSYWVLLCALICFVDAL